jgi:hypothetical protein
MVHLDSIIIDKIPNGIKLKTDNTCTCLQLFVTIIGILTILTLSIITLIGLGYLTESLFYQKSYNSYQEWQIAFMKVTIICFWIHIGINFLKSIYNNCKEQIKN